MAKLVVYESDNEVIVSTKKNEQKIVEEYFNGTGRDIDCFDRHVCKELHIRSGVMVEWVE